jgi:aryl-alcohol dehydrogenase-like predicted oxidoreductase
MSRSARRLGKTDLSLSPIGLGCWQFAGQSVAGMYWDQVPQATIDGIVKASLAGGVNWFDTAEAYGLGNSERALSLALQNSGQKQGQVVVATKWWPILKRASTLTATIDERIACLAPFPIDLHQVHQPYALSSVADQMSRMADLVAAKKIRAVGVSNFGARRMRAAHRALAARGVALASNQVRYSLVDRAIESNGTLAAAKELGITIIAYSPLGQGVLTGKFHDNPKRISGPRRFTGAFRRLEKSRPLIGALRSIAAAHGTSPARVALAWLLAFQGETVVAIPGATKESHVADNVGAMDLSLGAAELAQLDELSRPFL